MKKTFAKFLTVYWGIAIFFIKGFPVFLEAIKNLWLSNLVSEFLLLPPHGYFNFFVGLAHPLQFKTQMK